MNAFEAGPAAVVYCGLPPGPGLWAAAWTLEPLLWLAVAAWGGWTWWRRRGDRAAWAAWGALAFIYLSPLCALSAAFFAARTVHHVLLVALVAPLLAWPGARRAAPGTAGSGRVMAAFVVFGVLLWAWHAPTLYAWGLTSAAGYWLMQASLLASAWWFWHEALSARQPALAGMWALLGTVAHMGLLGALIAFAGRLLYPLHAPTALAFGVAPLSDQQLGGLIMWVPAVLPFLVAGLWRVGQVAGGRAGLALERP